VVKALEAESLNPASIRLAGADSLNTQPVIFFSVEGGAADYGLHINPVKLRAGDESIAPIKINVSLEKLLNLLKEPGNVDGAIKVKYLNEFINQSKSISFTREFLIERFFAGIGQPRQINSGDINNETINSYLADIIEFNTSRPEETLKYGQTILEKSQETKGTLAESKYILERLKDLRLSQKEGIDRVLDKYKLDAVVFPGYSGCDIAARAGYPSVIVPAGYTSEGEPFGITFTSRAYTEPQLITFAYAYEQMTKKRVRPVLI
jgi:hypothetical protein